MNQRSYLDYNATAPLREEVREAVAAALSLHGNPSSVHAEGRASRAAIEAARAKVAALVGAQPEDVIFTSGGTEANALALAAQAGQAWHCYLSAVEHPSVLAGGRFYRETTTIIPVTQDGVIDREILAKELEKHHLGGWRPFVSLMAANNETGAVQPVAETSKIVHASRRAFPYRRRSGGGTDQARHDRARRRHAEPFGAQDRRSARASARSCSAMAPRSSR